MQHQTVILPSGIKIAHKRVRSAAAYCGLSIGAGSRHERENEHGLAHFLEHMLFKGTASRDSLQISSFLEQEGGDLNAFTTKEETVIHAAVLRSDLEKAVDIIADVAFHSIFPAGEIKKEKDIVRDEINLYKDNPSEQIFDDFEALMFPCSSLGRSILGTATSLRTFTGQMLADFAARCYSSDAMVFSSVGDFSIDEVAALAQRYFPSQRQTAANDNHFAVGEYSIFRKKRNRDTHQAHCLLGNRGYDCRHPNRYALHLLVNLLGGPCQNSRLNLALRERHGLSYCVEMTAACYSGTGLVTLYFGTEKNAVEKCFNVVNQELNNIRNKKLDEEELQRIKKQMLGEQIIASESSEQQMLSMAKSMMLYGRIETLDVIRSSIEAVTAEQLMEVANEIFAPEAMSHLIYA